MDNPDIPSKLDAAALAGYEAALKILDQLPITEEERVTCLYAAIAATEMAKGVILKDFMAGYKIRPDKCISPALAAALAAIHTRDTKLQEGQDEEPETLF